MKPTLLRSIAALTAFLTLQVAAQAAPSVSGVAGTVSTGQTLRVSGSGFGSKSPAAPHLWADFENGINPSSLGQQNSWNRVQAMAWSTEGANGSRGVKASDSSGFWTMRTDYNAWTRDGQKSYIYKKQRLNFAITSTSQNWKTWRVWPKDGTNYPNIYTSASHGRAFVENIGAESGFWGTFDTGNTNWNTEEILFKASSAINSKDGQVTFRVNGQQKANGTVITRSSQSPALMTANYVVHAVLANASQWSPGWSSNNRVWVDDVYVDTTWSRVMIGDAPTLSSCRNFDIQIPTAWGDGSLSVVANTRSFSSGSRAYVYVFDSNNGVNANGYPITINQGSVAQNQAPIVEAGADISLQLGQLLTTLNPTVSDDNLPSPTRLTYSWSQVLGPTAALITNLTARLPGIITFPAVGNYVLRLTASDGALSSYDDVAINVQAVNQAPTANAGGAATVVAGIPLQVSGSVNDDGLPTPPGRTTVSWTSRSGPATPVISESTALSTDVRFPVAGQYTLRLTVSDGALADTDDKVITVTPATGNSAPFAQAGADQIVTLPAKASLLGAGTDDGLPSGSHLTYAWSQTAGPGVVGFGDINRPDTWASFSQEGAYTLRLTVSDGVLSHSDTVDIDVNPLEIAAVGGKPAITTVTGRLQPGGALTITGANFGAKVPAAPYVWADFESGAAPNPISVRRSWDEVEHMQWGSEGYGGTRGMKASDGDGVWTMRVDNPRWTADGQKLYIFKKQKINFRVSNESQNWKVWRMWPAAYGYPNIYAAAHNGRVFVENTGGESGFWGEFRETSTAWTTEESIFQASSQINQKDGLLVFRHDGREMSRGTLMTRSSAAPALMALNYVVHGVAANRAAWSPAWNEANRLWVDDVYVDTTWARVMIGDAPTHAACSKLEVQIPTAWSGGSLSVQSRPGRFPKGTRVYLYVFDKDGAVNENGFPLTIDGNSIGSLVDEGGSEQVGEDEPAKNVFNPARGENASLTYVLKDRGSIKATIFDRGGRRVKELVGEERLSGEHSIVWDGRNDEGSTVASGVYIAVLKGTEGTRSRKKIAVLK